MEMKRNSYLALALAAFLIVGCNRVPADMFPKTVGSFRLQDAPASSKEKGHKVYAARYLSSDNKTIRCSAFDASSEEEANMSVKEYGIRDESQVLLDETGKQIGLKVLGPWSSDGREWSVRWHKGVRAYRCITDSDNPEEAVKKFYTMWQDQISK